MKTALKMEKHCASIYTISIFMELQTEIYASVFSCSIEDITKENEYNLYKIRGSRDILYTVKVVHSDKDIICSCNKFGKTDLPCRHMFLVMKSIGIDTLPSKFINMRWTKDATLKSVFEIDGSLYEECAQNDERKMLLLQLMSEFHTLISVVENNTKGMTDLLGIIRQQKASYLSTNKTTNNIGSGESRFERFVGKAPSESKITINPPKQAQNKGSRKRYISGKEEAIEKAKKQVRVCTKHGQKGHNIRTCKEISNNKTTTEDIS